MLVAGEVDLQLAAAAAGSVPLPTRRRMMRFRLFEYADLTNLLSVSKSAFIL